MKGRVISAETGAEIHEEPDPAAWEVPGGILGQGKLERTEAGKMTGNVVFPVRGTMDAVMMIGAKDRHGQWSAKLRIGRDECDVLLGNIQIEGIDGATEDRPASWHGYIPIEEYTMRVEIMTDGALTLFDAKQPNYVKGEPG